MAPAAAISPGLTAMETWTLLLTPGPERWGRFIRMFTRWFSSRIERWLLEVGLLPWIILPGGTSRGYMGMRRCLVRAADFISWASHLRGAKLRSLPLLSLCPTRDAGTWRNSPGSASATAG